MSTNADQIEYWNELAGPKWVANQARLDRLMAPMTDALVAGAAPKAGESALDIGCGCGDFTLRLAADLGPDGRVSGVDVSVPMLAHAAARAAALAGPHAEIEWVRADAMTQAFAPVDLLASRYGVMFFSDKPRAFRNLRGALGEGGRFAFLTWRRRLLNDWMQWPLDCIAPVLATPEETMGDVGPFGLADDDETCRLLTDAGFADVSVEPIDRPLLIGTSVEDAMTLLTDTGPAATLMREAETEQREAAMALLRDGVEERLAPEGIVVKGACWLYRGGAG